MKQIIKNNKNTKNYNARAISETIFTNAIKEKKKINLIIFFI